jgi:CDP-diacylglycerol--glycerol-3-phosphate 3-phosphatidyltransferase
MVSLYHAKPAFQNRLRPLVTHLAYWGVTPNQVTVGAIALSALCGLAIACLPQSSLPLLALPSVLLARMALNAIDGMLAREHDLKTPLGGILNELGDVVSDLALYLPFTLIPGTSAGLVVGVVILAVVTEMAGVLGSAVARHRPYDGPMGKSDRALVFAALALALGFGIAPGTWTSGIWITVMGLELWTILNRVRSTLQEVAPCQ